MKMCGQEAFKQQLRETALEHYEPLVWQAEQLMQQQYTATRQLQELCEKLATRQLHELCENLAAEAPLLEPAKRCFERSRQTLEELEVLHKQLHLQLRQILGRL